VHQEFRSWYSEARSWFGVQAKTEHLQLLLLCHRRGRRLWWQRRRWCCWCANSSMGPRIGAVHGDVGRVKCGEHVGVIGRGEGGHGGVADGEAGVGGEGVQEMGESTISPSNPSSLSSSTSHRRLAAFLVCFAGGGETGGGCCARRREGCHCWRSFWLKRRRRHQWWRWWWQRLNQYCFAGRNGIRWRRRIRARGVSCGENINRCCRCWSLYQ
jgi:hypothetical protein